MYFVDIGVVYHQVLTTQRRSSLFLGGMVFNSTEYLKLMMRMGCLFVSEEGSTTSKEPDELAFSEDEETLVIRMYNLVGERLVVVLFLCVKNSGWTWINHEFDRPSVSKLNTIQTQTLAFFLEYSLTAC